MPASEWLRVERVGSVASVLQALGLWSLDGPPRRFDAQDWWFRLRFESAHRDEAPADTTNDAMVLGFDGLATLADVWLNGEPVLQSDNMFVSHEIAVGPKLRESNEILICCRSLDRALVQRRARPRWRTPMVEHQQLRWFRTTLLGRTPGWSPPAAVVGPWKGVWLERRKSVLLDALEVKAGVRDGVGTFRVDCVLRSLGAERIESVQAELHRNGSKSIATLRAGDIEGGYSGVLEVPDVDLWWPHTHGEPALYEARLTVRLSGIDTPVSIDLGAIGFRSIALDTADGRFGLSVNGVDIFCRGACWTPPNVAELRSSPAVYAETIERVRDAGMNMLRVGGTMVYEDDAFYETCDRLGVLVWQDLMFANMDYPADDAAFSASVNLEVTQQLERLHGHPCLTLVCGNSEVEQQAAMWGTAREAWSPPLFHSRFAEIAASRCPAVPYWPSSAHGGAVPHQVDVGSTSYFGVGAYLRPIDDARRSNLRFASESLAFANVPEEAALERMPGGLAVRVHHPAWKARSPRDLGAGWDFDDVRDYYFSRVFKTEPLLLRYSNHERYLLLSRIVTGEIMASAFAEWRRGAATCNGALIWFLRDFWAGAGWGVLDDAGQPKACYYYVKRACQPIALSISDEGNNGLYVHLSNDPGEALEAELEISTYRHDRVRLGQFIRPVRMPAHSATTLPVNAVLDSALDLAAAFRFSDSEYAVVAAALRDAGGALIAQSFHFPGGIEIGQRDDIGLSASARRMPDGVCELVVRTRLFAQAVHFDFPGHTAEDAYFHLVPLGEKIVRLTPIGNEAALKRGGRVHSMNGKGGVAIEWMN